MPRSHPTRDRDSGMVDVEQDCSNVDTTTSTPKRTRIRKSPYISSSSTPCNATTYKMNQRARLENKSHDKQDHDFPAITFITRSGDSRIDVLLRKSQQRIVLSLLLLLSVSIIIMVGMTWMWNVPMNMIVSQRQQEQHHEQNEHEDIHNHGVNILLLSQPSNIVWRDTYNHNSNQDRWNSNKMDPMVVAPFLLHDMRIRHELSHKATTILLHSVLTNREDDIKYKTASDSTNGIDNNISNKYETNRRSLQSIRFTKQLESSKDVASTALNLSLDHDQKRVQLLLQKQQQVQNHNQFNTNMKPFWLWSKPFRNDGRDWSWNWDVDPRFNNIRRQCEESDSILGTRELSGRSVPSIQLQRLNPSNHQQDKDSPTSTSTSITTSSIDTRASTSFYSQREMETILTTPMISSSSTLLFFGTIPSFVGQCSSLQPWSDATLMAFSQLNVGRGLTRRRRRNTTSDRHSMMDQFHSMYHWARDRFLKFLRFVNKNEILTTLDHGYKSNIPFTIASLSSLSLSSSATSTTITRATTTIPANLKESSSLLLFWLMRQQQRHQNQRKLEQHLLESLQEHLRAAIADDDDNVRLMQDLAWVHSLMLPKNEMSGTILVRVSTGSMVQLDELSLHKMKKMS